VNDTTALHAELDLLARNLRWFYDHPTRALFQDLANMLVGVDGRDPMAVLHALDDGALAAVAAEPELRRRIADLAAELRDEVTSAPALDPGHRVVAYLSAEFALCDPLKTYSGGLGVLAGDHLRSASDLALPLVAVGLAYRDGYFTQTVDGTGNQISSPAPNDLARSAAIPVVDAAGQRLVVQVPMGDGEVAVQAWRLSVGRVPLILLDTDIEGQPEGHRAVTWHLYGGDRDTRIRQELVLGVGGVRMLEAMGIEPSLYHLNEGHAAFAALERLGVYRRAGQDLTAALASVRAELHFTTHTPVPAGHDTFDHGLAAYHLAPLSHHLGVPFDQLWGLATGPGFPVWNQTVLGLKLAERTNGVARLHGEVSRSMFASLWPDRDTANVPIDHITNGVHPTSWTGPEIAELLDSYVPGWRRGTDPAAWQALRALDPAVLWDARQRARTRLLTAVQSRLQWRAERTGVSAGGEGLDPQALTIGFARRFATYKRGTLMLRDMERLGELLSDTERPTQILVAGKAHPADRDGQAVLRQLVEASGDPRLAGKLVFIEGYDLELGGLLTSGCDVWLNTPLRPKEASGTSGMKAAMNGGLNLSVLDGWWDEAVSDQGRHAEVGIGWSIGDRAPVTDVTERDTADAVELYRLLAEEVVPTFYDRDGAGLPQRWLKMAIDAIVLLSPVYSTHRMLGDYARRYGVEGA